MTTLHEEAERCRGAVRLGIARLDKKHKNWRARTETFKFDMRDPRHCVLAQVFGTYWVGLDAVGPFWWKLVPASWFPLKWDEYQRHWASRHGYDINLGSDAQWWALNLVWGEEIGGTEDRA